MPPAACSYDYFSGGWVKKGPPPLPAEDNAVAEKGVQKKVDDGVTENANASPKAVSAVPAVQTVTCDSCQAVSVNGLPSHAHWLRNLESSCLTNL